MLFFSNNTSIQRILRLENHGSLCCSDIIWWCCDSSTKESKSVSHSVVSNSLQPMDCSPPGSSVHGILQARILEWVAIPFSRRSSQPRGQTWVFCIAGRFLTIWAAKVSLNRWGLEILTLSGKERGKRFEYLKTLNHSPVFPLAMSWDLFGGYIFILYKI